MKNIFQKPNKALGRAPPPIIRSSPRRPSYTTVTICRGSMLVPGRLPGCWFRLWVSMSQVSYFCGFSCDVLDTSGPLQQDSLSSASCLAVGLCICLHQLLDEDSLRTTGVVFRDDWQRISQQSDLRRWSVQNTYPLLLGDLAGVILWDFWKFPFALGFSLTPKFLVVSFSTLLLYSILHPIPSVPITTHPQSPSRRSTLLESN